MKQAFVKLENIQGIGYITFYHPASNSMPSLLLKELEKKINEASNDDSIKNIVLQSEGRVFCAGASFDELMALKDMKVAIEFFMGFARVINMMRKSKKIIIAKVQGKAVGGGVGLIAAADYAIATDEAAIKLSELSIGIGPYVIAPAVKRKVGVAAFSEMSINASAWYNAFWAREKGLYAKVCDNVVQLEEEVEILAKKIVNYDTLAIGLLKKEIWKGTENWDVLLAKQAEISAQLTLRDFTRNKLQSLKK